jgi:hypothetical protein
MILGLGWGGFHEGVEVHGGADRLRLEAGEHVNRADIAMITGRHLKRPSPSNDPTKRCGRHR